MAPIWDSGSALIYKAATIFKSMIETDRINHSYSEVKMESPIGVEPTTYSLRISVVDFIIRIF